MSDTSRREGRATAAELKEHIRTVLNNGIFEGVLKMSGGIVFVLNHHRQIVAVNDTFKDFLGIEDPEEIFGQRAGEAVGCAYADTSPKGCGEGGYCRTCGAVESVRIAQQTGKIAERKVALRLATPEGLKDICLHVRAFPTTIRDEQFVVVFMQDISEEEHKFELEKIFFHDILNSITTLNAVANMINAKGKDAFGSDYPLLLKRYSGNLLAEIRLQQQLVHNDNITTVNMQDLELCGFLKDTLVQFRYHPVSENTMVEFDAPEHEIHVKTDECILSRILLNMLINAFEAEEDLYGIKAFIRTEGNKARIGVRNISVIPSDVSKRIFQKHYSTKKARGRGYGTFSMKLLGEKFLGGSVGFTSTEQDGTEFYIDLPLEQ